MRYCQNAILGLAEFDGFVSETCLTRADAETFGSMIAWADWKSLEVFRHSERYAKLMMSPYLDDVTDRAFALSGNASATPSQSELLAAA